MFKKKCPLEIESNMLAKGLVFLNLFLLIHSSNADYSEYQYLACETFGDSVGMLSWNSQLEENDIVANCELNPQMPPSVTTRSFILEWTFSPDSGMPGVLHMCEHGDKSTPSHNYEDHVYSCEYRYKNSTLYNKDKLVCWVKIREGKDAKIRKACRTDEIPLDHEILRRNSTLDERYTVNVGSDVKVECYLPEADAPFFTVFLVLTIRTRLDHGKHVMTWNASASFEGNHTGLFTIYMSRGDVVPNTPSPDFFPRSKRDSKLPAAGRYIEKGDASRLAITEPMHIYNKYESMIRDKLLKICNRSQIVEKIPITCTLQYPMSKEDFGSHGFAASFTYRAPESDFDSTSHLGLSYCNNQGSFVKYTVPEDDPEKQTSETVNGHKDETDNDHKDETDNVHMDVTDNSHKDVTDNGHKNYTDNRYKVVTQDNHTIEPDEDDEDETDYADIWTTNSPRDYGNYSKRYGLPWSVLPYPGYGVKLNGAQLLLSAFGVASLLVLMASGVTIIGKIYKEALIGKAANNRCCPFGLKGGVVEDRTCRCKTEKLPADKHRRTRK